MHSQRKANEQSFRWVLLRKLSLALIGLPSHHKNWPSWGHEAWAEAVPAAEAGGLAGSVWLWGAPSLSASLLLPRLLLVLPGSSHRWTPVFSFLVILCRLEQDSHTAGNITKQPCSLFMFKGSSWLDKKWTHSKAPNGEEIGPLGSQSFIHLRFVMELNAFPLKSIRRFYTV